MNQPAENLPEKESGGMIAVIERAALNPDVDPAKMQQLLDVQERILNKQAEAAFNRALTELQADLPVIKHTGKIRIGKTVQSTYTKYEDIDKVLRPLLVKHNFSLSFNTETVADGINIYGTLAHVEGHSKTAYIPLPMDTSGNKNNVQAVGSTMSYGKRYVVGMLINLVTEGEDDDGGAGGAKTINEKQAAEIEKLIKDKQADKEAFLYHFGIEGKEVKDLPEGKYAQAVRMLKAKK